MSPIRRNSSSRQALGAPACTILVLAVSLAWATPVSAQIQDSILERPFADFSVSASTLRDSLVAMARRQIGTRYRLGGETPEGGFDCSGLVQYVLAALQLDLPRTAAQQATVGREVPRDTSHLRPGDLLTFGRGRRASHIGIYVGDGRYVHASTTAGRVIESSLARAQSPLVRTWRGVRRVLAATDSVACGPLSTGCVASP